jgi:uncharacterized protein YoxC
LGRAYASSQPGARTFVNFFESPSFAPFRYSGKPGDPFPQEKLFLVNILVFRSTGYMREVTKEYDGDRLIRAIERNFDIGSTATLSETQAKLQAMEETLSELDKAVKALDRKWMTMITQQRDSLLKELQKQLALDIDSVKKAQDGYVKEVQSLRASLFQLEKGKLANLKEQLQKLRAAAPILAQTAGPIHAARPGLPNKPDQKAKPDPDSWVVAGNQTVVWKQAGSWADL